jgi:hypothetical protein
MYIIKLTFSILIDVDYGACCSEKRRGHGGNTEPWPAPLLHIAINSSKVELMAQLLYYQSYAITSSRDLSYYTNASDLGTST